MDSCEYQVTIKSANQRVSDYVTSCRSNWTVLQLKQHISQTHVNKPNVGDQRLIYAGNVLKDTHTLKQIFFRNSLCTELTNSNKTDFTIHLVCCTSAQKNASGTQTVTRSNDNTTSAASSQPTSSPSSIQANRLDNHQNVFNQSHSGSNTAAPRSGNGQPTTDAHLTIDILMGALDPAQQTELIAQIMQSERMRTHLMAFHAASENFAAELARSLQDTNLIRQIQTIRATTSGPVTTSTNNTSTTSNRTTNEPQAEQTSAQATLTPDANATLNVRITASTGASINTNQPEQLLIPRDTPGANRSPESGEHPVAPVREENINNDNQNEAARLMADPQAAPEGVAQLGIHNGPVHVIGEQEPGRGDVLDWAYYLFRAALLLVAISIHASAFRLMFTLGLLAVAYFFNRRAARRAVQRQSAQRHLLAAAQRFLNRGQQPPAPPSPHQGQQQPQQPQQQQPQPNGDNVPNNNDSNQAQTGADRQEPNRDSNNNAGSVSDRNSNTNSLDNNNNINNNNNLNPLNEGNAEQNAQLRLPFIKLCYRIVTDFLVSLIPER